MFKKAQFSEVFRFAAVGIISTLLHASVLIGLVENQLLNATYANLAAFSVAFINSYFGHYYWTYNATQPHRRTGIKFTFTAISGLLANYLSFFVIVDLLSINYLWAFAFVTTALPAATYLIHKHWSFK